MEVCESKFIFIEFNEVISLNSEVQVVDGFMLLCVEKQCDFEMDESFD